MRFVLTTLAMTALLLPACAVTSTGDDAEASSAAIAKPEGSASSAFASLTIDGVRMRVESVELWSEVLIKGRYNVFVKFRGPGFVDGSDIALEAYRVGAGCRVGENHITLRSGERDSYPRFPSWMPNTDLEDPKCGLSIATLPTTSGGVFEGTFDGVLTEINPVDPKAPNQRKVNFSFEVTRK